MTIVKSKHLCYFRYWCVYFQRDSDALVHMNSHNIFVVLVTDELEKKQSVQLQFSP